MKTVIALVLLLLSASSSFAVGNVKLYTNLEFSDNSVQQKAYNLPVCAAGEVYVNKAGSLFCGTLMPIEKGIAVCVSGDCTVSACMPNSGDCDHDLANGCEGVINTMDNCSCGVSCPPAANECITAACSNGACLTTNVTAGTLPSSNVVGNCQKKTCNGSGVVITSIDDADLPDDSNECTIDFCQQGNPVHSPVNVDTPCSNGACNNNGQCIAFICGNGIVQVQAGETCDDSNAASGDGCSPACQIEPGFSCDGSPSICSTTCGDGLVGGAEMCDDSNINNGDGCTAACQTEAGFTCSGAPSVCVPG